MAYLATIREDSPRCPEWLEIFGSRTVIVKEPLPHQAPLDGRTMRFYRLDVEQLAPDVLERLVSFVSRKSRLAADLVRSQIADPNHGVPILADDVVLHVNRAGATT